MAKKIAKSGAAKAAKPLEPAAPDHLTMNLFAPGMTAMHRAGLGGLACTLKAMERDYKNGLIAEAKLPSPFVDDKPPWEIDEQSVTLRFGGQKNASSYLNRLFGFAFGLSDGLINLPGQYGDVPPSAPVRARLQDGLLLSFYDHGPKARGVSAVTEETVTIDNHEFVYQVARLHWYKHQRDGARMALDSLTQPVAVTRMIAPGVIVRHDRHKTSAVVMPAKLLVPILFAPIGVIALRMGSKRVTVRGKRVLKAGAVVLIPDLRTLDGWHLTLPALLPRHIKDVAAGSLGDAVLAAEMRQILAEAQPCAVRAVWCCATSWNSQLQPRSRTLLVDQRAMCGSEADKYAIVRAALPPQIRLGRNGNTYLSDSVVRPLFAENLANGRPWYANFTNLMVHTNPVTEKPFRHQVAFEGKGIYAMITDPTMWDDGAQQRARILVRAVHEAMRMRYGQIASENKNRPTAMNGRMNRFRERLRMDLAGSKTRSQIRFALNGLFSRAGINAVLRDNWENVADIVQQDWQLARDLALLAMASYPRNENAAQISTSPGA